MSGLHVRRTGALTLVQDLGRPGLAAQGVSRSGAADMSSYLLGGRVLGHDFDNDHPGVGACGPAALEVLLGGFEARADGDLTVAITGAPAPAFIDGRRVHANGPVRLHDGQVLRLGRPATGLRTYVSVRGGFDVEPVLGSRSRDTLAGIGPEVTDGSYLPVGRAPSDPQPVVDQVAVVLPHPEVLELEVAPGPRGAWLADLPSLNMATWEVSERSDRVGVRLHGEPLERTPELVGVELPSEGVVRGAVQVPAGGQPVLFLADHPVTGGYPVVGVLTAAAVDLAAQAVPGQRVRLHLPDTTAYW